MNDVYLSVSVLYMIIAMAAAIGALVIAINQAKTVKEHNQKSVTPRLQSSWSQREYFFENEGIGPAIVTKLVGIWDNRVWDLTDVEVLIELEEELQKDNRTLTLMENHYPYFVGPGKRLELIRGTRPEINWRMFTCGVEYTDLYGTVIGSRLEECIEAEMEWHKQKIAELDPVDEDVSKADCESR